MKNVRIIDPEAHQIDYRLNQLCVRVRRSTCQLIARGEGEWSPLGPRRRLPIDIPHDEQTLHDAGSDALKLTAWQYEQERPVSDIRAVLSRKKDFEAALNGHS